MTSQETQECASCGYETAEPYCPECGQRKQNRFTIKYIFGELLALLSYDRGYLYNFFYLTFSPVQTLQAYLNGKTKNFYSPLPYFLSAFTVLVLLKSLAAYHIDLRFSKEITFVTDDGNLKNYYKEQEYLIKKKVRQDSILTILQNGEKAKLQNKKEDYFLSQNYENLRDNVKLLLIEAEEYQEFAIDVLEKNQQANLYASYVAWYFIPFYASLYGLLFYRKIKLFFTEHLILQLLIFGQIFWYITFSIIVALSISWIYTQIYHTTLPETGYHLQGGLVFLAMLYSFAHIFYIYYRLYQQHWAWLLIKLPLQLILLFLTMIIAATFTSYIFKGSF